MKKTNKQKQIFNHIKFSILVGICTFIMLTLVTCLSTLIYLLIKETGFINNENNNLVWVIVYALVCTIPGSILSVIIIQGPAKKTLKLLNAMKKIADGDYSVRLSTKSKREATVNIVDMFNHMAEQLGSTEIMSHDFINNFSHEFKTPIASINGFAKLLKNNNLEENEKQDCLDIIISETERLSNLSASILTLSKLERQTIVTDKTDFNLSEQIRLTIATLYPEWAEKKLAVDFSAKEVNINGNYGMLGQVWINLIENAVKFSPENSTISLTLSEKGQKEVIFTITNYGKNISEEKADRIFDKFYQSDISHATMGNGLGLAMAKRIIQLHGGLIELTQNADNLITFTVTLKKE